VPESTEHNAGIIGRIFEPCYLIINCREDQYTLIEQSLTVIQKQIADCSIRIGQSFLFNKARICNLSFRYLLFTNKSANLLAKYRNRGINIEHNLSIMGKVFEQRSIA